MSSLDEMKSERLRKLELLKSRGIEPYPSESKSDRSIAEFLKSFESLKESNGKAILAGRIMSVRGHGGSTFLDLFDGTGRVQIFLKKDEMEEGSYQLFTETVDKSDFIEVGGTAYITQRGEQSLLGKSWRMLAKSIHPVPDEWFGLKDEEERYRRRYLDILLNEKSADILRKKSIFWNVIRQYLLERGFIEVDTPVLENTTGGAEARPFVTHHNALDLDVYLRISAGELWQKRLLIAGIPRTFEIGRIFRNEGMSAEHLQDYTQLEFYMAYSDYRKGMEMTKELYRLIAQKTFGTTKFSIHGMEVDLANDWPLYNFSELMKEKYGIDPREMDAAPVTGLIDLLKKENISHEPGIEVGRAVDLLWKKIRKSIAGPGFLVGVPVYLEPLAKKSAMDEKVVERFQVLLAGSEMGKGFSELNDPIDQAERFARQQSLRDAGDDEAQMADNDFVEALEYGMPPAFGFGVSERLFSFLIDESIREAQAFPLMKPKSL